MAQQPPFPDKVFFNHLGQGHLWQCHVANFFSIRGLEVVASPIVIRPSYGGRNSGHDDIDLIVAGRAIEVKSRQVRFTGPGDVPSSRMPFFVDTVEKYGRKREKPWAYVIVSQITGAMLAVRAKPERWGKKEDRDRTRDQVCLWYTAPRSELWPIEDLVDYLLSRKT